MLHGKATAERKGNAYASTFEAAGAIECASGASYLGDWARQPRVAGGALTPRVGQFASQCDGSTGGRAASPASTIRRSSTPNRLEAIQEMATETAPIDTWRSVRPTMSLLAFRRRREIHRFAPTANPRGNSGHFCNSIWQPSRSRFRTSKASSNYETRLFTKATYPRELRHWHSGGKCSTSSKPRSFGSRTRCPNRSSSFLTRRSPRPRVSSTNEVSRRARLATDGRVPRQCISACPCLISLSESHRGPLTTQYTNLNNSCRSTFTPRRHPADRNLSTLSAAIEPAPSISTGIVVERVRRAVAGVGSGVAGTSEGAPRRLRRGCQPDAE